MGPRVMAKKLCHFKKLGDLRKAIYLLLSSRDFFLNYKTNY